MSFYEKFIYHMCLLVGYISRVGNIRNICVVKGILFSSPVNIVLFQKHKAFRLKNIAMLEVKFQK